MSSRFGRIGLLLILILFAAAVAIVLNGCQLVSLDIAPTATPTFIQRATATPTPTATSTPTVPPTATPTAEPPATVTPTATAVPTPVPPTPAPQVWVIAGALNVRSGPSTEYAVLAAVPQGTVLQPMARSVDGQWLLTCCVAGQAGWVRLRADLVSINFDPFTLPVVQVAAPTSTPTPWPTRTPTPLPTATPWPTPTATPWPTPIPVDAWLGEYYANRFLAGAATFVRFDAAVRWDWGFGSPGYGMPVDDFGVRWTRSQWLEVGQYQFTAVVDDGMRLWVDGVLVIDSWYEGSARTVTGQINLASGWHNLRVEFFEHTGRARIELSWQRQESFADWKGEYFDNRTLSGQPRFVRNDREIRFNWGAGAPAAGFPTDDFSVRWTRRLNLFQGGTYRFTVRVDDGARVRVDGITVLDAWRDGPVTEIVAEYDLLAGPHDFEVTYYEHLGNALMEFSWAWAPPTPTATPTTRPSATPTATARPTHTPTRLPTATPTSQPTATPTSQPTATPTSEPTATPTSIVTVTPENPAPTDTPVFTATTTPTSTALPAPTDTPTVAPTATFTPTDAPTRTSTATPTAPPAPTDTPTRVPTTTPTRTPTAMPTDLPAPTDTPTPTLTVTPTEVATSLPTENPPPTQAPPIPPTPVSTPIVIETPVLVQPIVLPIVITPTVGWISTPITVTATNWPANAQVVIGLAPAEAPVGATGTKVVQTRVSATGGLRANFVLPKTISATTTGQLLVVAYTTDRRVWGSTLLTLSPLDARQMLAPAATPRIPGRPAPKYGEPRQR